MQVTADVLRRPPPPQFPVCLLFTIISFPSVSLFIDVHKLPGSLPTTQGKQGNGQKKILSWKTQGIRNFAKAQSGNYLLK